MKTRDERLHELIFTNMFQAVGLDWTIEDIYKFVSRKDWFLEYSWTADEEREFKDWLVSEIRKWKRVSKRHAEMSAAWFLLGYGWKTASK